VLKGVGVAKFWYIYFYLKSSSNQRSSLEDSGFPAYSLLVLGNFQPGFMKNLGSYWNLATIK
jgi:hypothetical protein